MLSFWISSLIVIWFSYLLRIECQGFPNDNPPPICINELSLPVNSQSMKFLESILSPISLNDFMTKYFQKEFTIAKRPNYPNYYGPLVDLSDLHYGIDNGFKFTQPDLSIQYGEDWKLAKRIMKNNEYWTGVFENNDAKITADTAFYAVSQGYTLILNRAQSVLPNVYQASWQLEEALGWLVNTNLYLTASGGAQGFEAHIDWMDGFIFQTAGTKRWKIYDPPLIIYPRPDMTKKPSTEFLLNRNNASTSSQFDPSLNPPVHDVILRSGDLAYIPRGVVHEACTSSEDIPPNISPNLEDLHPYEMPSLHLTFGMEVGRDYTVEALLHHYISTQFKFQKWGGITTGFYDLIANNLQTCSSNSYLVCLVKSSAFSSFSSSSFSSSSSTNNDEIKTIRFVSDTGLLHFDLILSSQEEQITSQDGKSYDFTTLNRLYFEDFLHLFLSYLAHDTSQDKKWKSSEENIKQSHLYLLRQAVGINKYTSGIDELNPSRLFSRGVQVILDSFSHQEDNEDKEIVEEKEKEGIDLNGFFLYLLDHQMLSLSAYTVKKIQPPSSSSSTPPSSASSSASLLSSVHSIWETLQQATGLKDPSKLPELMSISHEVKTLSPARIEEDYVTLGSDKSLQYLNKFLSEKFLENNERIFDVSVVISANEEFTEGSIKQSEWDDLSENPHNPTPTINSKTARLLFQSQSWKQAQDDLINILSQLFVVDNPEQGQRNLCSSFAKMINTIKDDKNKRKMNGLRALRNAGHKI